MSRLPYADRSAVSEVHRGLRISLADLALFEAAAAIETDRQGCRVGWTTILKRGGLTLAKRIITKQRGHGQCDEKGLYQRGDIYWIAYSDERGQVHRESTHSRNKDEALQLLERRRSAVNRKRADPKAPSKPKRQPRKRPRPPVRRPAKTSQDK